MKFEKKQTLLFLRSNFVHGRQRTQAIWATIRWKLTYKRTLATIRTRNPKIPTRNSYELNLRTRTRCWKQARTRAILASSWHSVEAVMASCHEKTTDNYWTFFFVFRFISKQPIKFILNFSFFFFFFFLLIRILINHGASNEEKQKKVIRFLFFLFWIFPWMTRFYIQIRALADFVSYL